MKAPRKTKKRKTGRPLENVPLRRLVRSVKQDLEEKMKDAVPDRKSNDD
jgi:hypothetical protein